jgi:hypothetical protein
MEPQAICYTKQMPATCIFLDPSRVIKLAYQLLSDC